MQSSSGWNPSKKWLHTAHRRFVRVATASVASRTCHVAWCRCDCEGPRACRLRDARRTCRQLALHGVRCALVKPGALQIVHVLYVARCMLHAVCCTLHVIRCTLHLYPFSSSYTWFGPCNFSGQDKAAKLRARTNIHWRTNARTYTQQRTNRAGDDAQLCKADGGRQARRRHATNTRADERRGIVGISEPRKRKE